jgi:tRNA wybutosine-synthesizing protein 3
MKPENNLNPILLNEEASLPSFASLRERNLKTLYGDTKISEYINNDKSPKGSVDEKIRPLVNLINLHPEFVTLSSCSGRVAMFDPVGYADDSDDGNEITASVDETNITAQKKVVKGTEVSGKGRGKWIFVTHDVLPDLGNQVIDALRKAGMHRRQMNDDTSCDDSVITYKHEPPLLHIAASSLAAGKKLLHLAKSTCAMRESGLVVTDQRVTVELRTTGTLLCLPIMAQSDTCIKPDEDYLMALADMSNKRMKQNSVLLEKLYDTIKNELFEDKTSCQTQEEECTQFNVSLEPLPSLNLWKSASVVISSPSQRERTNCECIHVLAIGGQGIGPNVDKTGGKSPCCRRWDAIFSLTRNDGTWANDWKQISIMNEAGFEENLKLETSAGSFQVDCKLALGAREGHTAIVMPSSRRSLDDGVLIFGGRIGMSPSNDLFLFKMHDADKCILGRPIDVRGSLPIPRYGHAMNALSSQDDNDTTPLAVVSGGRSEDATLSCIHIISRSMDNDTGKCHLVWERINDMPNPRCYHAAELVEADKLYIFGGSDHTDPFSSSTNSSWFIQPIHRAANREHTIEVAISNEVKLPKLVGAAICSCYKESEENNLMLLSGGVLDQESHDTTSDQAPFHIINWNFEADGTLLRPEMATYSVTGSEEIKDLGTMVHHNLLKLPRSSNESISAVLFGGGVPSFSFGQSFSR